MAGIPSGGLIAAAIFSVAIITGLSPVTSLVILLYLGVTALVLTEPRLAYLLLPITVPFGSVVPLGLGSPVTPSDVIVGALMIRWLAVESRSAGAEWVQEGWMLALWALVIAMLISTFTAISITASVPELAKWGEVLVVAALAPVYVRTANDVWNVVTVAILAASAEAALGVGQFLLHAGPKAFAFHHRFLRAYGTFGQPNPLAGYLNMVLPVAVAAACLKRGYRLWVAAALIAAGSAATLSRAGWVAGTLALLLVLLFYWSWLRPIVAVASVGGFVAMFLAVMGAIPIGPLGRIATSFGLTGINFAHHTHANFSEIERAAHWVAGLRMFASHPFTGVGIGNYSIAYPAYQVAGFTAPLGHAHNYFINIAAEAGIVGLAAYTLFVMTGFANCISTLRAYPKETLAASLAIGTAGLWVSSTFHNFFDVLYVHEMPLFIAVMMGSLAALVRLQKHPTEPMAPAT